MRGQLYVLELLPIANDIEVFFHIAGEDEFRIGLRFVIDQEVQLATVEPCYRKLVSHR